jgi:hypothetical protein
MLVRLLLVLLLGLTLPGVANAGAISESFISDAIKSLNATERATRGGITVSLWVILFYIFYLGTIWTFNISMLFAEQQLSTQRRKFAKYFCRANIFLASGDTAMFIAFLIAYLFPAAFESPEGTQKLFQLLLLGVFTTSLTMSVYYFYIALYYRARFAADAWTLVFIFVVIFFIIRLMLHYNPENVWFSMMLKPGQPNYSAWLRNVPLFIYGLGAVLTVGYLVWKHMREAANALDRKIDLYVIGAMAALLVSFFLYALDVFYSHRIPHEYIWIVYTLKTLAYMVAFILMWLGEFYLGRDVNGSHGSGASVGGALAAHP